MTAREESQLLARAISRLRAARDARGALALLDQYDRSFPQGVMQPEALRARLEAVIQIRDDRQDERSQLLDRPRRRGAVEAAWAPSCC